MTGIELARKMLLIRPELPIVLCTGYSNLAREGISKGYRHKGSRIKATDHVIDRPSDQENP
jgi:DNA-binding LytR/AlgR family response regulator